MIKREQTGGSDLYPRKCESCKVFHWITNDGKFLYLTWPEVAVGIGKFFAKIYPHTTTRRGPQFIVYRTMKLPEGHLRWKEVLRWDWIPNWSPSNYQNPLRTFLPFL